MSGVMMPLSPAVYINRTQLPAVTLRRSAGLAVPYPLPLKWDLPRVRQVAVIDRFNRKMTVG